MEMDSSSWNKFSSAGQRKVGQVRRIIVIEGRDKPRGDWWMTIYFVQTVGRK